MRKRILICALLFTAVCALIGGILHLYVSRIPGELIEYQSSDKWGAEDYAHMAVYMTEDAGFDANTMLRVKTEIIDAYTIDSIETASALYSASCEETLMLASPNSARTSSCKATVYLGDYFNFHPIELVEGAFPDRDSVLTDALVIDELAAWQICGTQRGVVGLEIELDNDIYIVSGVASVPKGVYTEVYGDTPRVYINADSAGMRTESSERAFTSFEAMLPDPITNFAQNTLTTVFSGFSPVIVNIDNRFEGEALDDIRDKQTSLITDSSDTDYPYTEKAMIILALKASDVYAVQKVMMYLALAGVAVIFFTVFTPAVRFIEKLLSKLKF